MVRQFQQSTVLDVPIQSHILDVVNREWKDPDKISLPRFMAKLYPLADMQNTLPDSVPIDSLVARLVGRTSLNEDAIIKDQTDKKIDSALKKVYSGVHLALRAGIYATYVSQSLLTDFKDLFKGLADGSDCGSLLEHMERQIEHL